MESSSVTDWGVLLWKITIIYSYRKDYESKMASIADKLRSGPKFYVSITDILQSIWL
jgi:hypothetical protein